jgi:hypothetical protein
MHLFIYLSKVTTIANSGDYKTSTDSIKAYYRRATDFCDLLLNIGISQKKQQWRIYLKYS